MFEIFPATDRARVVHQNPTHRRVRRLALGGAAAVAVAALALTACSSSKKTTAGSAPTTSSSSAAAGTTSISAVAGRLVGPNGHTLYTNNVDTMTSIKCTGSCTGEWPPLTGTPATSGTLQATAFATVARPDGSMQVTFQGHPLYYFADDKNAGDVKGNITEDGISWHAAESSVVSTTGGVSSAPASSPSHSMTDSSGGGNGY